MYYFCIRNISTIRTMGMEIATTTKTTTTATATTRTDWELSCHENVHVQQSGQQHHPTKYECITIITTTNSTAQD